MMLRALCQQLSKRWFLTGRKYPSHPRKYRARLFLEALETRLTPSVDPLSPAAAHPAEPDVYLVNPGPVSPFSSPGLPGGFSPQQISQAYGFNLISFNNGTVVGNGSGQTIAIVDAYNQPNITSDLATFDSTYGIAAPPSFSVVNEDGGSTLPTTTDSTWGMETSLDVEWAHAMAPGANILLVEANSNSWSDLMTGVDFARNQPGVSVVSISWGNSGEWSGESSYDSTLSTPRGHNGVTFVAATGDSGSAGAPNYPSVSPNVLAVGGTVLNTDSAGNFLSESGWSGSSGGLSAYYAQPSYQNGVVTQSSTMRAVPDVAYNAASFAICDGGGWLTVGGTSAGAPQWSALIAIADQGRALEGLGTLDGPSQTLPDLYKLGSSDFHDITSGSNGAYSAGPGYDLVTGLGTPIANYLAADLTATVVPTTPTGLTSAAVADYQINLSWNSVAGARSYTLERSLDGSTWSVAATTGATTYSDTGLHASTTYYYRVMAANILGSSSYSAPVNATTQADTSSASFLKTDATTEGSWQGVYGSQGYNVIDNANSYPSYAALSSSANLNWVWANSTTDTRALQDASGSGRIAAAWYSSNSFTININLSDGKTHQLALYLLDWDNQGRSEQVQLIDPATGAVFNTQTVSNFANGEYLVWNVSGDVEIRISNLSGANAVLSGLFLDPAGSSSSSSGSATFVKSDTTTAGSWQGVYGSQGYNVIDNASSYPTYATVSTSGNANWVWANSTTDTRALEDASGSGRIAATWYSPTSFTINVNITDGKTHQLALYLLDWDNNGRSEQVQILDGATGTVLSTQTASNFQNGEYLVWNVSGNIEIRITDLSGANAVLSGMFFDPAGSSSSSSGSATFVKSDTTTAGSWQGVYGSQGYNVIDNASSYPSYATVLASGNANWVWSNSTTDTRALQDASGSGRIAATWYSPTSFTINVNITDGKTHQLALYLLDWDNNGRSEQVQILDGATGTVLSTQTASNFQNGEYLVWNVSGNIEIRITDLSGANAVLSGLFLDA